MGASSSQDKPHWTNLKNLDLDDNCREFPLRLVGHYIRVKLVDGKAIHSYELQRPSVNTLRTMFPKTYELVKNLYNKKVAVIYSGYRDHSNNLIFDSLKYDDHMVYYKMPPEYKDVEETFEAEYKEKYSDIVKQHDKVEVEKNQKFIDRVLST
jgi:hypothetical protein